MAGYILNGDKKPFIDLNKNNFRNHICKLGVECNVGKRYFDNDENVIRHARISALSNRYNDSVPLPFLSGNDSRGSISNNIAVLSLLKQSGRDLPFKFIRFF